jgi:DNA-binding response OmpR family regulator
VTNSSLPHILLADDESSITANLAPFLERAGFRVASVADGLAALNYVLSQSPDLVVLDVLMPGLDGREVLRRLRRSGDLRPVILLTQVGAATERALALEEGADDYLNKPFDPIELLARIRAVLRRAQPGQPSLASAWLLSAGGLGAAGGAELVFDRRARRVTLAGKALTLTPKALSVLEYLMTHPDELLTRERLLDAVWGWDYPAGTRTVDTRMAELRRALGDDAAHPRFIETLAGEGYRFVGVVRGKS